MQRSKCLFLETTRDKFKRYIQQIHNDTENLLHLCAVTCHKRQGINWITKYIHFFFNAPPKKNWLILSERYVSIKDSNIENMLIISSSNFENKLYFDINSSVDFYINFIENINLHLQLLMIFDRFYIKKEDVHLFTKFELSNFLKGIFVCIYIRYFRLDTMS